MYPITEAIKHTDAAPPMISRGPGDSTLDLRVNFSDSSDILYALIRPCILVKSSANSSMVTSSCFSTWRVRCTLPFL